jgi:hypothetical protein
LVLLNYLLVLSTFELIEHFDNSTGLGFKLASGVRSMVGDLGSRNKLLLDNNNRYMHKLNIRTKSELNFLFLTGSCPGLATKVNFSMIWEWGTSANKAAVKADGTCNACLADIIEISSFGTRPR